MKITIEMTEIDYNEYVRITERNAVAMQELEQKQNELETLAEDILSAYVNSETGEPETKVMNPSHLEKAKKLAEKVLTEKAYREYRG